MSKKKHRKCRFCHKPSDDLRGICRTCANGKTFKQSNAGWRGRNEWIKDVLNK